MNSIIEWQRQSDVSELKDRLTESIQSEKQREKDWKIWSVSRAHRTISCIFVLLESQNERIKCSVKKLLEEIMAVNISNLVEKENYRFKKLINPEEDTVKEIHAHTHHNRRAKN